MSDINAALMAQVEKHLPQMVGQQLRERLDLADKADQLNKLANEQRDRISALLAQSGQLESQLRDINKRTADIDARERKVELQELELKLRIEHCVAQTKFAEYTLTTVFRNREITYSMTGNLPAGIAPRDQYGNGPHAITVPVTSTTTVEG